jgi:tetratricopeptide (TPR) repeat protein
VTPSLHAGSSRERGASTSYERAVGAFNAGKLEEALRLAAAAEEENPKKPDIPNLRGAILTGQKRYDEAAEQFNSALKLDPNFYQAKLNLAEIDLRRGKYAEAAQRYEEMQQLDPESEILQFKLILCDLLSGDIDAASARADVMKFPGNTPAYYFARAAVALKQGNKDRAQTYFENLKKYYAEEQRVYFLRSLKDLGLLDEHSSEATKPQNQQDKKSSDEN